VTADLATGTRALLATHPDVPAAERDRVMDLLAAFRADPCSSGWYAFVVRLGLSVEAVEVSSLLGELDPLPGVTSLAVADAALARGTSPRPEAG
jgi:hypothetical protein